MIVLIELGWTPSSGENTIRLYPFFFKKFIVIKHSNVYSHLIPYILDTSYGRTSFVLLEVYLALGPFGCALCLEPSILIHWLLVSFKFLVVTCERVLRNILIAASRERINIFSNVVRVYLFFYMFSFQENLCVLLCSSSSFLDPILYTFRYVYYGI